MHPAVAKLELVLGSAGASPSRDYSELHVCQTRDLIDRGAIIGHFQPAHCCFADIRERLDERFTF